MPRRQRIFGKIKINPSGGFKGTWPGVLKVLEYFKCFKTFKMSKDLGKTFDKFRFWYWVLEYWSPITIQPSIKWNCDCLNFWLSTFGWSGGSVLVDLVKFCCRAQCTHQAECYYGGSKSTPIKILAALMPWYQENAAQWKSMELYRQNFRAWVSSPPLCIA